jgi:hypothetical protein
MPFPIVLDPGLAMTRLDNHLQPPDKVEVEEKGLVHVEWEVEQDQYLRQIKKMSPFIYVFHRAYCLHGSVVLRPDDVWLTIASGLMQLINLNPELYRDVFVQHKGTENLHVSKDGKPWAKVIDMWTDLIAGKIGDDLAALFTCSFTTTTPTDKIASKITLMGTVQAYFTYSCSTRCGIRGIELDGTLEDWQDIHDRTERLLKLFPIMEQWLSRVSTITKELLLAAQGKPSLDFWLNAYKYQDLGSGGPRVNGNMLHLFPLLKRNKVNPLLDGTRMWIGTGDIPRTLATVPFVHIIGGRPVKMRLEAGLTGICIAELNTYRAQVAWKVYEEDEEVVEVD